jgi:alanine dehydrogenase
MATLAVQNITITGLEATKIACNAGGDVFPNDGNTMIILENGSGGDITVTAATAQSIQGLAVADASIVVQAGEERSCGLFDPALFNNSSGQVALTYSGVSSLTVQVIRVR